jgi:glycosyltransferase involved in cell wall biosynthesis
VALEQFSQGSGAGFRAATDIPPDAFVVGHLGRLAPEKNIAFLAEAVASFMTTTPSAHFLVVGHGSSAATIRDIFAHHHLESRLHLLSRLEHPLLASAYKAMDLFAFTSKSETQGLVLTEAMAAGVPVVGLDAPGIREVVTDQRNGRLLGTESTAEFVAALQWVLACAPIRRLQLQAEARATASRFSMNHSAEKALALYQKLSPRQFVPLEEEYSPWSTALTLLKSEWELLKGITQTTPAGTAEAPPTNRRERL